jgi:hypothetical protein
MGDQIKNCLVGEAGSIVHKNPASRLWTYDDVVAQVGAIFGPSREHKMLLIEKLERRKRRKNEPLHALRDDICELVEVAYPEDSWQRKESICVERFIRALDNPKIVHKLLELGPRSLDEAFRAAKLEESTWHAACAILQGVKTDASQRSVQAEPDLSPAPEQTEPDGGSHDSFDDMMAEIRKLNAKVSDLSVKVDTSEERAASTPRGYFAGRGGRGRGSWRGRPGPRLCFRCQEPGHFAKECPAPAPVPKPESGSLN